MGHAALSKDPDADFFLLRWNFTRFLRCGHAFLHRFFFFAGKIPSETRTKEVPMDFVFVGLVIVFAVVLFLMIEAFSNMEGGIK